MAYSRALVSQRILLVCCWISLVPLAIRGVGARAFAADVTSKAIQQVDSRVVTGDDARKRLGEMLSQDVRRRRGAATERETEAWSSIRTRDEWEQFRNARVQALRRSLGVFPEPPSDLKTQVTGTVSGVGYRIENIVFESRPGLLVTANLYQPAELRDSMPGILICHSHHNPKTERELQEMGVQWARQGCLVLVMDQFGHGERRQHPFRAAGDFAGEFRVGRQDYYFRYNVGLQLNVLGDSLIGWMAWDMMRGVDLLLARPHVDRSRIALLGAVAGGGDPAAVTAALDERIAAVVPFNFGGPQPETTYPLPADAAKSFNYFGGGSWESTRNLRRSIAEGFAPWIIVGSVAPRRVVYAHEFAWDREHDPVWKRLETIYGFYNEPTHLASTNGRGSVRGQGLGNTHCNNIGPEHLEQIHIAFERWFRLPTPARENLPRHSSDELTCHTKDAAVSRPMRPVHELAAEIGSQRTTAARERLAALSPKDRRMRLQQDWARLLGDVEPRHVPRVIQTASARLTEPRSNDPTEPHAVIERVSLEVEPGITVPLVLLVPADQSPHRPVVIGLAQHGKQAFLQQRADEIAELLAAGVTVCLPDLRGTGETLPGDDSRGRGSSGTSLSSSELMLGQTLLGARVRDVRSVLRYLKTRSDIDLKRVALWGDSFAKPNSRDTNLAVPLDVTQPQLAEPLGGLAALFTALWEDDIHAVAARGSLVSFQTLLDSPFCHVPHDIVVPEALTAGDLCDVAATLAPRSLRLSESVDGQNRVVSDSQLTAEFGRVTDAYNSAKTPDRLTLEISPQAPTSIANWLVTSLKVTRP